MAENLVVQNDEKDQDSINASVSTSKNLQNKIDTSTVLESNHSESFSIRGYAAMVRSHDFRKSWPFCKKYLQTFLDNGRVPLLPPLEPQNQAKEEAEDENWCCASATGELESSEATSHNFSSSGRSKRSKRRARSDLTHPESTIDTYSWYTQQADDEQLEKRPLKPIVPKPTQPPRVEASVKKSKKNEDLIMKRPGEIVCPVCRSFSSTSNTALNAHIDHCLSAMPTATPKEEEAAVMNTENDVLDNKNLKPKPIKKRTMSDIIASASFRRLEDFPTVQIPSPTVHADAVVSVWFGWADGTVTKRPRTPRSPFARRRFALANPSTPQFSDDHASSRIMHKGNDLAETPSCQTSYQKNHASSPDNISCSERLSRSEIPEQDYQISKPATYNEIKTVTESISMEESDDKHSDFVNTKDIKRGRGKWRRKKFKPKVVSLSAVVFARPVCNNGGGDLKDCSKLQESVLSSKLNKEDHEFSVSGYNESDSEKLPDSSEEKQRIRGSKRMRNLSSLNFSTSDKKSSTHMKESVQEAKQEKPDEIFTGIQTRRSKSVTASEIARKSPDQICRKKNILSLRKLRSSNTMSSSFLSSRCFKRHKRNKYSKEHLTSKKFKKVASMIRDRMNTRSAAVAGSNNNQCYPKKYKRCLYDLEKSVPLDTTAKHESSLGEPERQYQSGTHCELVSSHCTDSKQPGEVLPFRIGVLQDGYAKSSTPDMAAARSKHQPVLPPEKYEMNLGNCKISTQCMIDDFENEGSTPKGMDISSFDSSYGLVFSPCVINAHKIFPELSKNFEPTVRVSSAEKQVLSNESVTTTEYDGVSGPSLIKLIEEGLPSIPQDFDSLETFQTSNLLDANPLSKFSVMPEATSQDYQISEKYSGSLITSTSLPSSHSFVHSVRDNLVDNTVRQGVAVSPLFGASSKFQSNMLDVRKANSFDIYSKINTTSDHVDSSHDINDSYLEQATKKFSPPISDMPESTGSSMSCKEDKQKLLRSQKGSLQRCLSSNVECDRQPGVLHLFGNPILRLMGKNVVVSNKAELQSSQIDCGTAESISKFSDLNYVNPTYNKSEKVLAPNRGHLLHSHERFVTSQGSFKQPLESTIIKESNIHNLWNKEKNRDMKDYNNLELKSISEDAITDSESCPFSFSDLHSPCQPTVPASHNKNVQCLWSRRKKTLPMFSRDMCNNGPFHHLADGDKGKRIGTLPSTCLQLTHDLTTRDDQYCKKDIICEAASLPTSKGRRSETLQDLLSRSASMPFNSSKLSGNESMQSSYYLEKTITSAVTKGSCSAVLTMKDTVT